MFKKEWFNAKLTLWQKIRLWFKPKFISVDIGNNESSVIQYKKIDDKIVILEAKKEDK